MDHLLSVVVILWLIVFPIQSNAQIKSPVHGIIYELESEMPLSGAHILINESSYGTISGPDGSFRLIISEFPAILKVSHIGFEDRYFTVTEKSKEDKLMLGLKFSAELLEGVTISDKQVELIFKDASYAVLDFEFHENGLMLLIYRNRLKRAELILLSTMNDTLASLTHIPGRANSLHRDCRNNIHYVAHDSAYQIHFVRKDLKLIHPVDIRTFIPVAESFVAYHDDNYYYGVKSMQKQIIQYYRYDSTSRNYYSFRYAADKKMLKILRDNPMQHYLLNSLTGSRLEVDLNLLLMGAYASIEAQRNALSLERDASREAHYLRACVYYPVYAPLFRSGEVLLMFNHPESKIEFLSPEGVLLKSTPIEYHNKANWADMILQDEISGKFYTLEINSNRARIYSVNPHTGDVGSANILHYPFVKKILIRNGYAYFTYRQPGSIENTMLFRQKLKQEDDAFARSEMK